jgi:hypothetical protein
VFSSRDKYCIYIYWGQYYGDEVERIKRKNFGAQTTDLSAAAIHLCG